jgi:chorismate synthase
MSRLRWLTAGESHGRSLGVIVEGVPAGLSLSAEQLSVDLARRQRGYGRGERQSIEQDTADIVSGVRRADARLADPAARRQPRLENWGSVMQVDGLSDEDAAGLPRRLPTATRRQPPSRRSGRATRTSPVR